MFKFEYCNREKDLNPGLKNLVSSLSEVVFILIPFVLISPFSYLIPFIAAYFTARKLNTSIIPSLFLGSFVFFLTKSTIEKEYIKFFGVLFLKSGFSDILSIFIGVYIFSIIKSKIKYFASLISTILTCICLFFFIFPILRFINKGISFFIMFILVKLDLFSGFILGLIYPVISALGFCDSFQSVSFLISSFCGDILLPLKNICLFSQFSATFISLFKIDKNERKIALICTFSCLLGFSLPAIWCVNLKYLKPFFASVLGSGVGCFFAIFMSIKSYNNDTDFFHCFLENPECYSLCFILTFAFTLLPLLNNKPLIRRY